MERLEKTLVAAQGSLREATTEVPEDWAHQSSKVLLAATEQLGRAQQVDGLKAFLRTLLRSSPAAGMG